MASVVLSFAGCGESSKSPVVDESSVLTSDTVTINELAGLLGMQVTESAQTHVRLQNSANTVMIFTVTGGRIYVNATPVGDVGTVEKPAPSAAEGADGQVRVSRSLVDQIRSELQKPAAGALRRVSGTSACIVIDAGHGGKDPGATSVLGYHEKGLNLAVASEVARLLSARGFTVRMTRSDDSFIELEDRAAFANRLRADLFVSIHADSFPKSSRRGYTVYVAKSASDASFAAARSIDRTMSATGLNSFGTQTADYKVLIGTRGPAVLVEMGYLTNRPEAALLKDPAFQSRIAQAIATGITDHFN